MPRTVRYRELDWFLLGCALLIAALGVTEIYSTTLASPHFAGMHLRQLLWIGLGLALLFILARIDYHTWLDQAAWLYLAALASLIAVLFVGKELFGARRWLEIGGINFQVSEVTKLVIIIGLARYLSEVRTNRLSVADLTKVGLLVGVPMVLIRAQPDLGTALTLVPIGAIGILLAGLRWKHAAILVLAALLALPAGWYLLAPYQRERLVTFVNPGQNPKGPGYQVLQSKIAVGSGGFWGKGMGKGSQNQLGFIPVRHAEFIMAAYAEEQGFAGVL
ncbi:MAG: FtsW/RodA/SpoVE family cell cycle protein, partial [Terriglobia bacterium]